MFDGQITNTFTVLKWKHALKLICVYRRTVVKPLFLGLFCLTAMRWETLRTPRVLTSTSHGKRFVFVFSNARWIIFIYVHRFDVTSVQKLFVHVLCAEETRVNCARLRSQEPESAVRTSRVCITNRFSLSRSDQPSSFMYMYIFIYLSLKGAFHYEDL